MFATNPLRRPGLFQGVLIGAGALLYLTLWLPATGLGLPCVFHELTGLYCPGCGITRAAVSLLQLDFAQAFRFNPLLFFLFPFFAAYLITHKAKMNRTSHAIMAVMLIGTIAFGLMRNLPHWDWLAPTVIR